MEKSYYDILELQKNASVDEIKQAYRKLAKKYHPDLYTHASEAEKKKAEAKIKEINQAYSVLSDPQKKKVYDTYGSEDPMRAGASQGGGGYSGSSAGFDFSGFSGGSGGGFGGMDFGDILSSIFGGGGFGGNSYSSNSGYASSNGPERGSDIRAGITITLDDVAKGVEKVISLKRMENCQACHGTGAEKGTAYKTCEKCKGTGQVKQRQRTPFGEFAVTGVCPDCGGTGKIILQKCSVCQGRQRVQKASTIKVRIPKGIQDGQGITFSGEGSAGRNGGPRGNLVIEVHVKEHEIFKRKGSDLYVDVPISFMDAILGTSVDIPTFNGIYKFKILEGTQSGQIFVVKGYGLKKFNAVGSGDLYLKVVVEIPTKATVLQKARINEMKESFADTQFPKRGTFLRKIKTLTK